MRREGCDGSEEDIDEAVVFVVNERGAKRVRYGKGSDGCSSANGFSGVGVTGRCGSSFGMCLGAENGRRCESIDDIDGWGRGFGRGAHEGLSVVSKRLY